MPRSVQPAGFARRDVAAAAVLGVAAVAISAIGSGTASLWGDEAASLLSATRPLPSLAVMAQHVDAVHTLYYFGLHLWIGVFGASPVALRFPSALAIGLAVSGLVLLGRRMRSLRFGILAGAIAAVLPRLTDVGSEARSFALTAAVAVGLSLLITIQLQSPRPSRQIWVAYAVLLAFGTVLFLWILLIAVAHLVALLLTRRELLRGWRAAFLVAMGGASPVLVLAVFERGQVAYLATRQAYDVTALFVTPWFESPWVALGAWPLVIAGVVLAIRDWRTRGDRWRTASPSSVSALIPVAWMLIPAVALIASSVVVAVYTPRYLAMCAPAIALLIAVPIDAILGSSRRASAPLAVAALLAVVALIAPVWVAQRGPYAKNYSDWAQISAKLAANARPGDAVAFDDSTRPSRRTRLALHSYPAGFKGLIDVTLKTPYTDTSSWYDATYTLAQAQALGRLSAVTRIWVVEYAVPGHVDQTGLATLKAGGFRVTATIRNHRSEIVRLERG